MLVKSKQMKSTKTSDFEFLKDWLMLATWSKLFFMNLLMLSLLIGMIICFLDKPLVVIWMHSLEFVLLLMILWIWLIFWALRAGKVSLILITLDILLVCLDACAYNFLGWLDLLTGLVFLKYLEIWLISFCDLAGIRGGIFLMLAGICYNS